MHQVGPRARGILRRHSRHARRRAGDERRRVRRRDLDARRLGRDDRSRRRASRAAGERLHASAIGSVGPGERMVPRRAAALRAAARREQRRHSPAARAPQGDAADRRMVVRFGVHESAGRSRGAPDRQRGTEGFSHRRRARVGDAREFHRQRRHGQRRGHRAADRSTCSRRSSSMHGVQLKPEVRSWERHEHD